MIFQQQALVFFGGIVAILVIASGVGQFLAHRHQGTEPSLAIENLNARINSWWAMVGLLGFAFVIGKTAVIVLSAILSFAALREFITLTETRRGDHWMLLAAFFVILPAQYVLIWDEWYGLYSIFIPVYAFLALPILSALRGDGTQFLDRVAHVQWGLMISVFCLSHVPGLLTLKIDGFENHNLMLIAFLVGVVQASDVLQYIWGKLLGKHKIAPTLSPGKTVEGFVGGIASATALGASLWWITPFSPWQAAGFAFVISMMGFLGGLVMSAIKRDRGVKDWGASIPGHGGILDRIDSVLFAAPVFFHLVRFWWTV